MSLSGIIGAPRPAAMLPPPDHTMPDYVGPRWWSASRLFARPRTAGIRRLALVVLALNLAAILTGIMNVAFDWNGIPVDLGPVSLDLTIYPPLLLSVLAAVWIGPTWGLVPAYLGNFASAIYGGVPPATGALFACAGTLETAIVWGAMVTLDISADLRRWRDLTRFVAVGFIAATISSLAVLIWNTSLGLDFLAGQRVWRGWVLGDFLLLTLVVAPILHWAGPAARSWIDRQFAEPPRHEASRTSTAAFAWSVFALMSVLVLIGANMLLSSLDIPSETRTASGELLRPRLLETTQFVALLVASLILATGAFATALARLGERARVDARRESLTGCYNRRAFYEFFRRESERSRRLGQGISVVVLDVDYFKSINDRYGHEVGDEVLRQFASRVGEAMRDTDLLFRWGGEEFVVLLPHTGPAEARPMAERIRSTVAGRLFQGRGTHPPLSVTVSIGIAGSTDHHEDADAMVARADAACYRAKQQGRDRIASSDPAGVNGA